MEDHVIHVELGENTDFLVCKWFYLNASPRSEISKDTYIAIWCNMSIMLFMAKLKYRKWLLHEFIAAYPFTVNRNNPLESTR